MNAPNYRLDGGVALVTGAGSGIGRAIARAVAASGARVGCVDLPSADLPGVVADITSDGGRAVAASADVTDGGQLATAVTRIEQELGPLSAAVNAAGIANAAPAEEMSVEQWQRVVDVDLTGVFLSCQAEGRAMLRNGGGAVVNIASMSATIANRDLYQLH
jgi:NAD(P)-dependent dehydrogenase (short-subunit alcohol dehydrogenase family)